MAGRCSPPQAAAWCEVGECGVTCLRPVVGVKRGVWERDRAAQNVPREGDDRQTHSHTHTYII